MSKLEFNGNTFNDDRLFILHVCKCTIVKNSDVTSTTIYHEEAPDDHSWCVVTFWNDLRYKANRVDHFDTENEAMKYAAQVEPQTPLISLGGRSPKPYPTSKQYLEWKELHNMQGYDYKKMFSLGSENPRETIRMKSHKKD